MITLEDMINLCSDVVERAFAKYGEIKPHWYAITRDGGRKLIPPPPVPLSKDQIAVLIRQILQDIDTVQVLFVDECWQVRADTDEQMANINRWYETHPGLEHYPGRIEVVGFQAEHEDGRLLSANRQIIRKGGKAKLGPLEVFTPSRSEGRMTGWLPARGTRQ